MRDVKRWMQRNGYTQEQLAEIAGVSQAQICRMLTMRVTWHSVALHTLCAEAGIAMYEEADPSKSTELREALRQVWNGTPIQARAIADLLLAAKGIAAEGSQRRRSTRKKGR